jgi:hypothetical protein
LSVLLHARTACLISAHAPTRSRLLAPQHNEHVCAHAHLPARKYALSHGHPHAHPTIFPRTHAHTACLSSATRTPTHSHLPAPRRNEHVRAHAHLPARMKALSLDHPHAHPSSHVCTHTLLLAIRIAPCTTCAYFFFFFIVSYFRCLHRAYVSLAPCMRSLAPPACGLLLQLGESFS